MFLALHRPPTAWLPSASSSASPPPLPTLVSPLVFAVPVLLILLRVTYVLAANLVRSANKKKHMSYVVKWGRERLYFSLPPPDTKLSVIRAELAAYTQLPAHSFKLIHAGAVMKDDNAPISAYGIKRNSTIALVGGDTAAPEKEAKKGLSTAGPRTEAGTISQIRIELEAVRRTLVPDVDVFLTSLAPSSTSPDQAQAQAQPPAPEPKPTPTPTPGKTQQTPLAQEHTRLGELLLQALLRLDAITAEGEWEGARRERKGAVREVQALLDRLDGGWRAYR